MAKEQVIVVTDGGVKLPAAVISQGKIAVLPRYLTIGRRRVKIDRRHTVESLNKRSSQVKNGAAFAETRLKPLISYYKTLSEKGYVPLSIHLAEIFDDVSRQAKVARSSLHGQARIEIVESCLLDIGTTLLVTETARFVQQHQASQPQALTFALRLHEKANAIMITGKPYAVVPKGGGQAGLKAALPMFKSLLLPHRTEPRFVVAGVETGVDTLLNRQRQAITRLAKDRQVHVGYQRKSADASQVIGWLKRVLTADVRSSRSGLEASFLPADAITVLFWPEPKRIQVISNHALKYGGG